MKDLEETKSETENADGNQSVAVAPESANRVVTTTEELQAYYIVKAIVCAVIDPENFNFAGYGSSHHHLLKRFPLLLLS